MSLSAIILFVVYTYGLGFTITGFIKNFENFFERTVMRVGIGIGAFILLGVVFNLLRIPLDWKIFLIASMAYPAYCLVKAAKSGGISLKIKKPGLNLIILFAIFSICLYMYSGGAFKYPYLEDDDPWEHALSVKYIATEKKAYAPQDYSFKYLDPYPPGYDLLMGVLHQTSPSVSWTLKFFNGLIISLGMLFFYFFAKQFMNDRKKALFSTMVLAAVPSYFTHFIWAHSLAIMLLFPALYCLEMIRHDKKWVYPAMVVISSILLTQPTKAIKIGMILGLYWLVRAIVEKSLLKDILKAGLGGLVLSLIWWLGKIKAMFLQHAAASDGIAKTSGLLEKVQSAFSPTYGTATRAYTFQDFFVAKPYGGINVQVGWGIAISLLVLLGIVYAIIKYKEVLSKKQVWIPVTLAWFLFAFLGTNSMTFNLPVGLFAFRFWLLLAIPVALLSSLGLKFMWSMGEKSSFPKVAITVIVIIGVIITAGYQKFNHNTMSSWPPGVSWTSSEEIEGYLWLKNLEPNTKVFAYAATDKFIIGFDKYSCQWCSEVVEFRESLLDRDAAQLHSFLKKNNYEYVVFSGMSYVQLGEKFGENQTKEKIDAVLEGASVSGKFAVAHQTKGAVIFKVL